MSNTLGGIPISDNMYLKGVEQGPSVMTSQVRTMDGISYVSATPIEGGRALTLGSTTQNSATQGFWCLGVIREIKALEKLGQPVLLEYQGTSYNVLITGTSSLEQFDQRVALSDEKVYTGQINLIEV